MRPYPSREHSPSLTRSLQHSGIRLHHDWLPRHSASSPAYGIRLCASSTPPTEGYVRLRLGADGRYERPTPSSTTGNASCRRTASPSTLLLTSELSRAVRADIRLYCGFENAIEVFDVATPGYDSSDRLKLGLTRREKGGQRGTSATYRLRADRRHHLRTRVQSPPARQLRGGLVCWLRRAL